MGWSYYDDVQARTQQGVAEAGYTSSRVLHCFAVLQDPAANGPNYEVKIVENICHWI